MMLGPLILAILAFIIVRNGNGWFTLADFTFLAALSALLLGRWVEFRGGNPQTSTGEPATLAHLRRYALGVILLGLGGWIAANLLGNHWLNR
jgi:hypothetical protein